MCTRMTKEGLGAGDLPLVTTDGMVIWPSAWVQCVVRLELCPERQWTGRFLSQYVSGGALWGQCQEPRGLLVSFEAGAL
jgi:hypothetical protein